MSLGMKEVGTLLKGGFTRPLKQQLAVVCLAGRQALQMAYFFKTRKIPQIYRTGLETIFSQLSEFRISLKTLLFPHPIICFLRGNSFNVEWFSKQARQCRPGAFVCRKTFLSPGAL